MFSEHGILGELPLGLAGVHSITGDSSQLFAAVILIVNVVGDIFEILHVGPWREGEKERKRETSSK